MQFPNARILIFSKAVEPGQVKTRLIPRLGAQAASELHRVLLWQTVEFAASADLCPVIVCCAPHTDFTDFDQLQQKYSVRLSRQNGADLGERMFNAASESLKTAGSVILIGTDCPGLDRVMLKQALQRLQDNPAVLGPAEDGGYVLLGLRKADSSLFVDMPWGTDQVLKNTRQRLERLGWQYAELPILWDLDRPEDLLRLAQEYPELCQSISSAG